MGHRHSTPHETQHGLHGHHGTAAGAMMTQMTVEQSMKIARGEMTPYEADQENLAKGIPCGPDLNNHQGGCVSDLANNDSAVAKAHQRQEVDLDWVQEHREDLGLPKLPRGLGSRTQAHFDAAFAKELLDHNDPRVVGHTHAVWNDDIAGELFEAKQRHQRFSAGRDTKEDRIAIAQNVCPMTGVIKDIGGCQLLWDNINTVDFIPILGTVARAERMALMGAAGEDEALPDEGKALAINAASDIIPEVGKALVGGAKSGRAVSRALGAGAKSSARAVESAAVSGGVEQLGKTAGDEILHLAPGPTNSGASSTMGGAVSHGAGGAVSHLGGRAVADAGLHTTVNEGVTAAEHALVDDAAHLTGGAANAIEHETLHGSERAAANAAETLGLENAEKAAIEEGTEAVSKRPKSWKGHLKTGVKVGVGTGAVAGGALCAAHPIACWAGVSSLLGNFDEWLHPTPEEEKRRNSYRADRDPIYNLLISSCRGTMMFTSAGGKDGCAWVKFVSPTLLALITFSFTPRNMSTGARLGLGVAVGGGYHVWKEGVFVNFKNNEEEYEDVEPDIGPVDEPDMDEPQHNRHRGHRGHHRRHQHSSD